MKSPLPLLACALILSACNSQPKAPEVVDTNPDPMANQLANAAPVELPPAIASDKTYRCKDQSLVYVVLLDGGKQAIVRTEPGGSPTTLNAATAGEPMVAEGGWSLTGDAENITLTTPTKASQSCHV
jgi:transposase InsO family protein